MDDMNTPRRRPGRPPQADPQATRERIVAVATGLFARHGFDAVSVRQVADAAGVDVATVHHHTGGKAVLYESCFARVFTAEQRALEPVLGGSPDLHRVLDAFLDFLEEWPENTGLWLRRWLDPTRHQGIDERYSMPLYERVERLLAAAGEPHPRIAVRSLIWAVHAHAVRALHGEVPDEERAALREFAHRWVSRMYPSAP